jgi:RNA polymerase sigma-70 factor (ECF subfamily)
VGATDADDLLQDVLFIIVRKIASLEDPAVFYPWAFRIASRQAFRHLKKRRAWQQRHEDDAALDAMAAPELPIEDESMQQLLTHECVSPASRAVLLLHFELELSLPECAAILEIPLGTVKSRLAYGLRSIRRYLKESGGSHG